ncbi:hypothetical protein M153_22300011454 [Pseudoloma neurophilia]|uniref:Glutaredoxin domain-containing protein n=1 Tax=Pseudoloma neurophilia TaxID=146866 RepID=A0A0R0LZ21_9MICR|nr:hypothetical protein M153_22300011454 [Pseudoloma neurophilia]
MLLLFLPLIYKVYADACTSSCDTMTKISAMEMPAAKCTRTPIFKDDARLNDAVAKNEYVVVGKNGCQWCSKALGVLQSRGKQVEYIDLATAPDLYNRLSEFLKYDYVPIVIHKASFIGGYTELINCMAEESEAENLQKLNEKVSPVVYPPDCTLSKLVVSEPTPEQMVQLCPAEKAAIQQVLQPVQPLSNAALAIKSMETNQQANQLMQLQQQKRAICQLEQQKNNLALQAQQKEREAKQAACVATTAANNITLQQNALQANTEAINQQIVAQAEAQKQAALQKADCVITQQQNAAMQKAAELAAASQPVVPVVTQTVPVVTQTTPVVVQTAPVVTATPEPVITATSAPSLLTGTPSGLTPVAPTVLVEAPATSSSTCQPEANNPLLMGEPQNVQTQLTVVPMQVTSSC